MCVITDPLSRVLMAWCLIKHRVNASLHFTAIYDLAVSFAQVLRVFDIGLAYLCNLTTPLLGNRCCQMAEVTSACGVFAVEIKSYICAFLCV
jgi:hypothetical protein